MPRGRHETHNSSWPTQSRGNRAKLGRARRYGMPTLDEPTSTAIGVLYGRADQVHRHAAGQPPWVFEKSKEEFPHVEGANEISSSNFFEHIMFLGRLPQEHSAHYLGGLRNCASSSKLDQFAPTPHGQDNTFQSTTGGSVPQNMSDQSLEGTSNSSGLPKMSMENKECTKPSGTSVELPVCQSSLEGGAVGINSSMLNSELQTALNISTTSPEKPGALSFLPFLGVGSNAGGLSMKMPTPPSGPMPSWLAMFQRIREENPSSPDSEVITGKLLDDLQRLRMEVDGERQQLQQEREHWERERQNLTNERERLERQVEYEREQKQTAEHQVNELTTTVTSVQRALDENRQSQSRDWVVSRDEVRMSSKILGVGGWGSVVEGRFRGTIVAVKQIHELILSHHNRRLFEREMNIASRCRHPCLLQFIGATNDDASPLFVTELMEKSLRALLQERGLALQEILNISTDVARALNYLHLNRPTPIIHRDISSANVLLWRQGETWRGKVSDYGTANFVHQTMTKAPGAPPYSAPEALTSVQSTKLDVYSFGVLLCEMFTRELPVPQQQEEQIALVTNQALRRLIRRCVKRNPEARLTMEEIINELEAVERFSIDCRK